MIRELPSRAGLFVGSLLIGLLAGEASLRLFGFRFDVAPESVEFGFPTKKELRRSYLTDPDLFWVTKDYQEKLRGLARRRPHILFMGDSCTEFGTYHRLLLERLQLDRPEEEIVGEALGVGAWSSYQGLQQMRRDVVPSQPRVVTIYYGWNDHWIGFGVKDSEIHELIRSTPARLSGLRLAQLAFKARVAYRSRMARLKKEWPVRVPPVAFRDNLREIARLAKRNGIVPLLLTAPTSHEAGREPDFLLGRWMKDLKLLVPLHQRYVSIVREVAVEEGVPLCDLAARFAALPPVEVRETHFKLDGIHPTAQGDQKAAAFLHDCFIQDPRLSGLWSKPQ